MQINSNTEAMSCLQLQYSNVNSMAIVFSLHWFDWLCNTSNTKNVIKKD